MFSEFWKLYPRKVAKKDAMKMWARLSTEQQTKALEMLPAHVKVWEAEGRQMHLVPHAATWINGERFDDEITLPAAQKAPWWTSDAATMDYGRSKGVPARPGEDMNGYRQRLRAA